MLEIKNLHAEVDGTEILKGVDLKIDPGEVHAIMGPNGSGKSTLANVVMGNPVYEVTKGSVVFEGEDITEEPVDNRAKLGMFLAFQYPESIPGVTIVNMLKTALTNIQETEYTTLELRLKVAEAMEQLGLSADFADRYLNEGFSGGERKRNEILQLAVLDPKLAVNTMITKYQTLSGRSFMIATHSLKFSLVPGNQPVVSIPISQSINISSL